MSCYAIDGIAPVVDPTAFVHETASLIGDVIVGPGCYVGPFASLRGDFGRIIMGEGSNVQDNAVMHAFPGADAVLEPHSHIGHAAVLHGCRVGSFAMVGIGSIVLDGAVIGAGALVGAGSLVTSGFRIGERMLAHGSPAREVRELGADELAWKENGVATYRALAGRSIASLREVRPLAEPEPGRRRMPTGADTARPLGESRRRS